MDKNRERNLLKIIMLERKNILISVLKMKIKKITNNNKRSSLYIKLLLRLYLCKITFFFFVFLYTNEREGGKKCN